jgi:hypothetical protein
MPLRLNLVASYQTGVAVPNGKPKPDHFQRRRGQKSASRRESIGYENPDSQPPDRDRRRQLGISASAIRSLRKAK